MQILGILETAIYVCDVAASIAFYRRLFGFPTLDRTEQFGAFDVGGRNVLLIFERGTTNVPKPLPGGTIPPHNGDRPTHLAFAIWQEDVSGWERKLAEAGVSIEGRVTWPRGGLSIYFRDPDDNLLELVTPGLWSIY